MESSNKVFVIPDDRIQFVMDALVKYYKVSDMDKKFLRARAMYIINEHLKFIDFMGGRVEWSKQ